jgi:hypothetical protein
MKIEDRIAALKTAIVAATGMEEVDAIEVRLEDLDGHVAHTADGGDAIVIDRAKAEAADDDTLRFIVNHELLHAYFLKHGTGKRSYDRVVADDAGPFNADVQG